MLRSYRSIKGKPAEKVIRNKNTGKKMLVRHSRKFFANLTTENFISSFDNEDPYEIRNPNMVRTIDEIHKAISHNKALNIQYGDYNINKELCPRKDKNGNINIYYVYPIKMVVSLGRYYLYCRQKYHSNLSCMRIDRIITCSETKDVCEWHDEDTVLLNGIGEPHFAHRLYMFTGKAYRVTFLIDKNHLNDVFDWFGSDVELNETEDKMIKVIVKVDKNAMLYWAMQYIKFVQVIDPPELVENIKQALVEALDKYENQERAK